MVLDRETIFASEDAVYQEVDVPEWGGTVRVRSLTGMERDQYEQSITVFNGPGEDVGLNMLNARAKLASLTCVDEDGRRIFSDADAIELGSKSAAALNRVYEVSAALSGLSEQTAKEADATFEGDPVAGPSSASLPSLAEASASS